MSPNSWNLPNIALKFVGVRKGLAASNIRGHKRSSWMSLLYHQGHLTSGNPFISKPLIPNLHMSLGYCCNHGIGIGYLGFGTSMCSTGFW